MPVLRLGIYLGALMVALLLVGVFALFALMLLGMSASIEQPSDFGVPALLIVYIPLAVAVVLITFAFVVFVDRRPPETLGLARQGSWKAEALLGLCLGAGLPLAMFAVSYLAGWSVVTGSLFERSPAHVAGAIVGSLLLMAAIAVMEEAVSRGYVLQTLRWGYGVLPALVVSSLLFGVVHLANPSSGFPALLGVTAAGLLLGYGYLVTRRLWLPIAFHFGWNFALGPVLGFPVSGILLDSWVEQRFAGPALWTGGDFGPEAGLLGLTALLVGTAVIRLYGLRMHRPGSPDTGRAPDLRAPGDGDPG